MLVEKLIYWCADALGQRWVIRMGLATNSKQDLADCVGAVLCDDTEILASNSKKWVAVSKQDLLFVIFCCDIISRIIIISTVYIRTQHLSTINLSHEHFLWIVNQIDFEAKQMRTFLNIP